jgi:hypothetical protein
MKLGDSAEFAQGITEPTDCGIQRYLEIDKCVRGPQPPPHLFPCDGLSGAFHESSEDLKRLFAEGNRHPPLQQPATVKIDLECSETDIHGRPKIFVLSHLPVYILVRRRPLPWFLVPVYFTHSRCAMSGCMARIELEGDYGK